MKTLRKILLAGLFAMLALNGFTADSPAGDEPTLTEQLKQTAKTARAKTPTEKEAIIDKAIDDLQNSNILKLALKKGDTCPSFKLPDVKVGLVSSDQLLQQGPLVIVFYRGGWCPYCSLQLHDLQKHLAKIKSLGAQLVAISPQTPDNSMTTAEKQKLQFYVLSDAGNEVAKKFGIVYPVTGDLKELYKEFGLDLSKTNGTKEWELPLAASYVVAPDGKIIYSFVDADYEKRAETNDIIAVLKNQKINRNQP